MKNLIITLCVCFIYNVQAQDFIVDQDPFKTIIVAKYLDFQKKCDESKKLPKLTKDDLMEILSTVPIDDNSKFSISSVRQVNDLDKGVIFDRLNQTLVDVFVDANSVIQMNDKNSGVLVCKGYIEGTLRFNMMGIKIGKEPVIFTMKIQTKDGRYKIDIYDIYTEKGDLLDEGSPIELYLNSDFYNTSFGSGVMKTKRTDSHYVNVRTQLLLTQLYGLYCLEENIYNRVKKTNSINENW